MASPGIAEFLLAHAAKREAKHRAAVRIGLGPDASAMRFDYGAADRKSDAHALAFGGNERLEELFHHVGADAAAGVRHTYCDDAVRRSGRDGEMARRRVLHGFDRVADEIEQHLLHLDLVGEYKVPAAVENEL